MTNGISHIVSSPALEQLKAPSPAGNPGEFQNILDSTIQQLSAMNQDAATSTQRFLDGENEELHNVVLSTQKAEMAFELGLQVRNKVVQAYQEIMRMQM